MRVLERAVYRGPHLFGPIPMIRFQLDLGPLEERPSNTIEGFADRLLALLPTLNDHACSLGRAGGFVERLRDGTWLGHVTEHVALALQTLAGVPVTKGKTRSVKGQPGVYNVLIEYQEEEVGLFAARLALELVDSLLPEDLRGVRGLDVLSRERTRSPFDVETALNDLKRLERRVGLGPTTGSIVAEAKRRGIPVLRLDERSLVQLGWGARQERIRASITGRTSFIGVETASDKDLTKTLLAKAGVPVPRGVVVRNADDAVREAQRLGGPVVVKPLDGNHGRGVSTNLTDPEQIRRAFQAAAEHSRRIVVEQFFSGNDHRLLVVGGELVAVAERVPAHVVGDGASTIRQLIDEVNKDPRRGEGHEQVLTKIKVDEIVEAFLAEQGLDVNSTPASGQKVYLRGTANLSTGGTAVDRTDDIHPDNACIAIRAALSLGLDVAGIDFICPDISKSVRETSGGIVEVNAAPGFRMHLQPTEGRPRPVAPAVVRMLFPKGESGRIPIFAITGTNGKSTTGRMLSHILRQTGLTVGLTNTSGVYVNSEQVLQADASGPKSARMVLHDPMVDAAVFEVARGGLLREGLAFDRCDIGAVTNVQPDHLGLKGIDTVQDLAWVKSIVVENVADDGISVLNADDVLTARMRRRSGGRPAFFSLRGGEAMPPFLREHIVERGGLAAVREPDGAGGELVVYQEGRRRLLMRAAEIPATFGGLAEFNVANALTAACMAIGHGVNIQHVRLALATFGTAFEQNPGRLNVFDGHGFRVIMDYAHNAAGLIALRDLLQKLRPSYRRQIGMVTIPGDRRDEDIRAMGEVAALTYDEMVLREDPSRRGRREGEIIQLLAEGARRAGADDSRIHRVADEMQAAETCMSMARPGDLVVLTPTEVEDMWQRVLAFQPNLRPNFVSETLPQLHSDLPPSLTSVGTGTGGIHPNV
ncbi:cyanophycin synthetase [Phenylobacterium deserti]|uniref:Cyanophycin synthetase n=2 Tax=Phenylobacterium deserti TaxID=1914756 RepID=A0A328AU32_9CAUL|nr:cyanophycin synthetase [Phenylobacterium deserti]RAK56448.1 cyanophycin synthetase [Phenylobacterium deserti]